MRAEDQIPESEAAPPCGESRNRSLLGWCFTLVFLVFLLLPAGGFFWNQGGKTVPPLNLDSPSTWFRQMEDLARDQPLFLRWRQQDQALALELLHRGNRRVFVGRDRVLHYQPDLEALTGKGAWAISSTTAPAPSGPQATTAPPWSPPLPLILDFARQLEERDIELVFVAVPTKAMLSFHDRTDPAEPLKHPDYDATLQALDAAGVTVIDLLPPLARLNRERPVFLKQDTHWTTEAMELSARFVAESLPSPPGSPTLPPHRIVESQRHSVGDLAGMLELPPGRQPFSSEAQTVRRVLRETPHVPLTSDPSSEIVLLGDSFVNLYEDPSLGFAEAGEESIGAGFASHLAVALGQTLHVLAQNGGGSTGVRQAFAHLPPEKIARKKQVVWVLSSRDWTLSEASAARANIRWQQVDLPPAAPREDKPAPPTPPEQTLTLRGRLREKSHIPAPATTTYPAAIHSVLFDEIEAVHGTYTGNEAYVFFWAFRDRKREDTAHLEIGQVYEFTVVPLESSVEAMRATQLDDVFAPGLDRFFSETIHGRNPAEAVP